MTLGGRGLVSGAACHSECSQPPSTAPLESSLDCVALHQSRDGGQQPLISSNCVGQLYHLYSHHCICLSLVMICGPHIWEPIVGQSCARVAPDEGDCKCWSSKGKEGSDGERKWKSFFRCVYEHQWRGEGRSGQVQISIRFPGSSGHHSLHPRQIMSPS